MPSSSSSSTASTSVQVAVRIRPSTSQDQISIPVRFQRTVIHGISPTSVAVDAASSISQSASGPATATAPPAPSAKKQFFSFDQVHDPQTTQQALFTSTAKPLISRFVEGFNCTILAYGQTSSGKTFTMTGIDLDSDPSDSNNGIGIVPRAVYTIFSRLKELKEERGGTWNYSIKGSFIEIYNEDLIDLLSVDDSTGGRREVQIREDKDGHIIWGGLREVSVRNVSDVMTLIRKGTSIRRTNETEMNAQSSRSHAIFSLTLTQKKYTGQGPPPRSVSPLPPNGRSPSRLARPGSVYSSTATNTRVSSPTFGRPPTPSFASAMGRGGVLRPSSALGHSSDTRSSTIDDDSGGWITLVSKFHFVDLAGSERLKRTAAVGDRIKEGISINSGLLALGNVISALGDPSRAKTHTASHVPYRDSKLTRLLQDSLGGNAHTLMIACVSPAEWNVGETVNTLKYANRARNIKNRAVLNEKEDGWDDVEWLQGTVTRLRKELKTIKEGGAVAPSAEAPPEVLEGAGKKVLARLTDLQNNYEDLQEKFVDRTEELTRLRRELGERQRSTIGGAVGGTSKYEEIVGPVIEEYEKTIAAMEAGLSLNRAALRHTNEMVEEKEEELAAIVERHATTDLYLEDLRARVAKLTEREASTEAYIRDLEEKIKAYDETSITSSESMTDLKREVSRFRDTESHSAKYIADLELRLARSDESVVALQQTVEKLEKEAERRRDEVEELQSRLRQLNNDGNNWRVDLQEREKKVSDLEKKVAEWERKKKEAGDERLQLGTAVGEVVQARKSSENLELNSVSNDSGVSTPNTDSIETQLVALQQTHTATLTDLASVTAKYRDALREISDLAAQMQEAKLNNSLPADVPVAEQPTNEIPPCRSRKTGSRARDHSEPQVNSPARRPFFRQAASAESLHTRSLSQSQSLSQELSSARSRKISTSSHATTSSVSSSPSYSHPRPSPSLSGGHAFTSERSVASLENEIMRLQEVLKEREQEISVLEGSLQDKSSIPPSLKCPGSLVEEETSPIANLSPRTLDTFNDIRRTMINGHDNPENGTEENSPASEADDSLDRLNELMLSMAQKESYHREVVETLNSQLSQVRRQLDDLTTLSRDQALNMSTEMEALRGAHEERLEQAQQREAELLANLEQAKRDHTAVVEQLLAEHGALQAKKTDLEDLLSRMTGEHETSIKALRRQVKEASEALEQAHSKHKSLLEQEQPEHEAALRDLRDQLSQASAALENSHQEHEKSLGELKADHEDELRRRVQEVNDILASTIQEHEVALANIQSEHEELLKQKAAETSAILQRTEEEYYEALTKLREDHTATLEKQTVEAASTLQKLREEHAGELRMAEIAREGLLSESQSSQAIALQALQDEHAAAIARKDAFSTELLKTLKAEHSRALASKDADHTLGMDKMRSEGEGALAKLKEQSRVEVETLKSAFKKDSAAAATKAREDMQAALKTHQASWLKESKRAHEEDNARLKKAHEEDCAGLKSVHEAALLEADARLERERSSLLQSHAEDTANLQEQHRQTLEEIRTQSDRALAEEREQLAATLVDLKHRHAEERKVLRKGHDVLVQELETHKLAAEEYTTTREEVRQSNEEVLNQKTLVIEGLEQELSEMHTERDDLEAEAAKLRGELDKTRSEQSKLIQEASKRASVVDELEKHRSVLAELQENLQRVKDEKDNLQMEKDRQDLILRDLQAQIARSSSPPGTRTVHSRATVLPTIKLPPPTPPPSVPPPPAPKGTHAHGTNAEAGFSVSSQASSSVMSPSSSRESQLDSPATSVAVSATTPSGNAPIDPKIAARLEAQTKRIDEQEAMIKTLNKQLTHCESDLQTHMDLVSTLETSLGDSEKNLRKARMHATELARERDSLNIQLDKLRVELQDTQREVMTARRSIVEEKQSLEHRLDEERKAKERARAQLDARMEELQRRKSKFACI